MVDRVNSESFQSDTWRAEQLMLCEILTALVPSLIGMAVVALIILAALW